MGKTEKSCQGRTEKCPKAGAGLDEEELLLVSKFSCCKNKLGQLNKKSEDNMTL